MEVKKCSRCGEMFPEAPDYVDEELQEFCKDCRDIKREERRRERSMSGGSSEEEVSL